MLRHTILIFSVLLVSITVHAQEVRFSVAGEPSAPVFEITNLHSSPISAFIVTVDLTTNGTALSQIYYDIYSDDYPRGRPIRSAASKQFPLPHFVGAPLPPTLLQAVVFADGSTWGNAAWANELLKRRRILLDRLQEIVSIMKEMDQKKLPSPEALAAISQSRSLMAARNAEESLERKMLHDRVFHMAMKNVAGSFRVYGEVPEAHVAAHYLGMTFDTWRVFLQSAKPSPADWSPSAPSAMDNIRFYSQRTTHASALLASYGSDRDHATLLPASLPKCAQASDASYELLVENTCGDIKWELLANVSGQLFDKGPQDAFGTCYGDITDCQGVFHPKTYVDGEVNLFNIPGAPVNTVEFGWNVDNYQIQVTSCGNCNSGTIETEPDFVFKISPFYVDCQ